MAELDPTRHATASVTLQRQLPLEVRLRDEATLDNFLVLPGMEPVLSALQTQLLPEGESVVYLYGPPGTGKSHLLQAVCHESGVDSLYLPLALLRDYPAEDVLQGVATVDLLCIDDLHAVLGVSSWERALFNTFNAARERGCRLVVAADAAPRALSVGLEDLRSRLAWGIVFQLATGDDADKSSILQFRARRRGLVLTPAVADYIISRAPRAMEPLVQVLEQLDQASLAQQRALSIPFVKQAMGW